MEDCEFSSTFEDTDSFCSHDEQKAAFEFHRLLQRPVSHVKETFIHMIVPALDHWVAVQVTISPFTLQQFPEQTFFSSKLRYGPCCQQINCTASVNIVKDTTQKVVDAFYHPVRWNYSSSQCYTLDDPTDSNIASCASAVKSRLKAYLRLAGIESTAQYHTPSSLLDSTNIEEAHALDQSASLLDSTNIEEAHALDQSASLLDSTNIEETHTLGQSTSLLDLTNVEEVHDLNQSTNTDTQSCTADHSIESPHSRANETCVMPRSPSRKRKNRNTELAKQPLTIGNATKKRREFSPEDAQEVQTTVKILTEGLGKLTTEAISDAQDLASLASFLPSQTRQEAHNWTKHLWKFAEEMETTSATVVWYLRFSSACSLLVDVAFASASIEDKNSKNAPHRCTLHNWRCLADIVNSIVNGMLPFWKEKAYLIYHVFAVKGIILSKLTRVSQKRQMKAISLILNDLRLLPIPSVERVSIYNPSRFLSTIYQRDHDDICRAIGLSYAMTGKPVDVDASPLQVPYMAKLGSRMNDYHLVFNTPNSTGVTTEIIDASTAVDLPQEDFLEIDYTWNNTFDLPQEDLPEASWATEVSNVLEQPLDTNMLKTALEWDHNLVQLLKNASRENAI